MTATWEVTEYDVAARYGLHGVDGPVRPVVVMTLVPTNAGTRVRTEINFETHGVGKLFGVLARLSARHDIRADLEHLKEHLEAPSRL
jgi:Polyketide cyclase / dehydrase and lipid transport